MPAQRPHKFEYVSDLNGFRAPSWQVVRLGGRLNRKRDLFWAVAKGLKFPSFFGENWDALEECLRDLSWLGPPAKVVLLHEQLPLADDCQRKVYFDILHNAQATGGVPLRVVFPASAGPDIGG